MPITKFEDGLKIGQKGEEAFMSLVKAGLIERSDGRNGDFYFTKNKAKIELKSDYYDANLTENFFIERYSNWSKKTDGGPWQALNNDCKYYVYFFPKNGIWFVFKTDELVRKCEELIKDRSYLMIKNNGYITIGYKIPRNLLESIRIK